MAYPKRLTRLAQFLLIIFICEFVSGALKKDDKTKIKSNGTLDFLSIRDLSTEGKIARASNRESKTREG